MEIITETMKGINGRVEAIQYPKFFSNNITDIEVIIPEYKDKKESVLLFIRHTPNIKRLFNGTESKIKWMK